MLERSKSAGTGNVHVPFSPDGRAGVLAVTGVRRSEVVGSINGNSLIPSVLLANGSADDNRISTSGVHQLLARRRGP